MFDLSKKQSLYLQIIGMVICIGFITVGVMYEMMFGVIIFSFFLGLIFSAFLVMCLRKNGENKKTWTNKTGLKFWNKILKPVDH